MKSNVSLIIIIILSSFELWIGFKFIDNNDILIYHTATFSFTIMGMLLLLAISVANWAKSNDDTYDHSSYEGDL